MNSLDLTISEQIVRHIEVNVDRFANVDFPASLLVLRPTVFLCRCVIDRCLRDFINRDLTELYWKVLCVFSDPLSDLGLKKLPRSVICVHHCLFVTFWQLESRPIHFDR